MRVFAYCAESFQLSVSKAAGVTPLLSPPTTMTTFSPFWLDDHDFIYFKLHGWDVTQPYWYGDNWVTAISAAQIRQADLRGAVVFAANCYLSEGSPMYEALKIAGASAIIGGDGENYAASRRVAGADLLGMWTRRFMQIGLGVATAFALARARLHMTIRPDMATADALGFGLHRT